MAENPSQEEDKKIDEMMDREIARQKAEEKKEKEEKKQEKKETTPEKKQEKPKEPTTRKKEEKQPPEAKPKEKADEKEVTPKGNPWKILQFPHLAEKAMNMVEAENTLVFIVNKKASKDDIWEAVEDAFNVEVVSVRTQITPKGEKKAVIKLHQNNEAADVATRLGMI